MSYIMPGIFVGGLSSAKSKKELDENQITHILTALHYPVTLDPLRVHKQFLLRDSPDENLECHFVNASEFIHKARKENGKVLIHCACGISRSVTLTIAYLLCITDFSLRNIFKAVRAARMGAHPNSGFLRQLVAFEQSEGHKKTREFLSATYGEWPADRAAEDAKELQRFIDIQDEYILTGYYPGDKPAPSDNDEGERNKSYLYTLRVLDEARTLDEALQEIEKEDKTVDT